MAKGRGGRGPSRLDRRREAEAVEAREKEETQEEVEEGDEEEEPDAEAEAEGEEAEADEEAEVKPKAKKKAPKKVAAPKAPSKRSRAAKEVRRRAVWVVYDNANKVVGTFAFNQKAEAEAALARKIEEKKGTFFLNLVKEEIKD